MNRNAPPYSAENKPVNPELDASWLQRLEAFVDNFRVVFRRRDQARWACVYLQGLLLPMGERKTTGTMARRAALPSDLVVEDVSQALQNFVNQSPWDERLAGRICRGLLARAFADPSGAFVMDEITVPKQGRRSVGVQRQYSSSLGRKVNCQVAVVLYHFGSAGICPLFLRLYLPRNWLNDVTQMDSVGVPSEYRRRQTRSEIALELLDQARAESWQSRTVVVANTRGADPDFRTALNERGLVYVVESASGESVELPEHQLPSADGAARAFHEALLRTPDTRSAAGALSRILSQDIGLEHFEGRSWRGFHHHACLVQMAFAFRALSSIDATPNGALR